VRFGVVGLGYWGQNYLRLIEQAPETELVAMCDGAERMLEYSRGILPHVRATSDAAEVFAASDVDAVVIATPARTHYPLVRDALLAGKQVLCEKPLTVSARDGLDLVELAGRTGCTLFVGHTFVYNAGIRALREFVDGDELGDALHAQAVWAAPGPVRDDVSALWDLAPHPLSILTFLLGRQPLFVAATGQSILASDRVDVAFLHLRYDEATSADIQLSWLAPRKMRVLSITGERKLAIFDDMKPVDKLEIFDTTLATADGDAPPRRTLALPSEPVQVPEIEVGEPLRAQLEHFLECCRYGTPPDTDAAAGTTVVQVLEAAQASLDRGGEPVRLDAASTPIGSR
jgi:predicted dehydrogenase